MNQNHLLLVVNFKTYLEATGKKSVDLARAVEAAARERGVTIAVAVQFTDIKPVSEAVEIPIFSQHIDPIKPGAQTGHVLAEAVKAAGASGTLLNHSERRMKISEIEEAIELARTSSLRTLVCANTSSVSAAIASLGPEIIAIEPPELIGTGVSVSKAQPELITRTIEKIRKVSPSIRILCGAGVTTPEDVGKAIELGSEGVLVSSSVVKSKDPRKLLMDMADSALEGYDKLRASNTAI